MKVLLINASPRPNGNTALALREMEKVFVEEGVEVDSLDRVVTFLNRSTKECGEEMQVFLDGQILIK